jgi:hypothetical protein
VIAVGAMAAIVGGSFLIVPRLAHDQGPATATTPTATRSEFPAPGTSTLRILPLPNAVDLGAVPPAEAAAAANRCEVPGAGPKPYEVLWSRRVMGFAGDSGVITTVVQGGGKVAVCRTEDGTHMVDDTYWQRQPGREQGASAIVSSGWFVDTSPRYREEWTVYHARPEVVRIESRFVWNGGSGPWIKGVVAGGFAYTDSRAMHSGESTQQVRAYDANGREVPIQL